MRLNTISRAGALTVALAVLLLSFLGSRVAAASSTPTDVCQLQAASAGAIQGRVERVTGRWADEQLKLIESDVQLHVTAAAFGPFTPGSLVTVRVRGGQMPGLRMVASEEAAFVEGGDVLVFLSTAPAAPGVTAAPADAGAGPVYYVTDGSQGIFDVTGNLALNQGRGTAYTLDSLLAALGSVSALGQGGCAAPAPIVTGAAANRVAPASGSAGADNYVYNGYKWPGANPMDELYYVNPNSADAAANGGAAAFTNAIVGAGNTWTAVASANFTFRYGGATSVTQTANDGVNAVHWENMGAGTLLAEATTWYDGSGRIIESDIRFNDSQAWDATGSPTGGEADVQSVALHELGHWLSLGHDTDATCASCPATGPSMCSCYPLGRLKRNLATNDINGISAIYPMPQPPATPTSTSTPTRTATPTQTRPPTATPTRVPRWWPDVYLPLIRR